MIESGKENNGIYYLTLYNLTAVEHMGDLTVKQVQYLHLLSFYMIPMSGTLNKILDPLSMIDYTLLQLLLPLPPINFYTVYYGQIFKKFQNGQIQIKETKARSAFVSFIL